MSRTKRIVGQLKSELSPEEFDELIYSKNIVVDSLGSSKNVTLDAMGQVITKEPEDEE